jgi:hypothetical protein
MRAFLAAAIAGEKNFHRKAVSFDFNVPRWGRPLPEMGKVA